MSALNYPIEKTDIPAHVQVRDRIVAEIERGILKPGDMLPSEPVLAEQLGVSRMTANKAILALVGKGLLKRIRGQGTYVCDILPRQTQKRCAVAICSDTSRVMEDYYFGQIFWQLQTSLDAHGVETRMMRIESGSVEAFEEFDSVIAIAPDESVVPALARIARSGVPVVVVGARWRSEWLSEVDSDNVLGSALAVNHLLDLGHRRLLFVGALPSSSNTIDRRQGFWFAAKARSLATDSLEELMLENVVSFTDDESRRLVQLLTSIDRPTAVFCGGPAIAMFVKSTALGLGLSLPDDLSIVAYDDPVYLAMAYPPITTIRQPLLDMAAKAVEVLVERSQKTSFRAEHILLDPELIVRQSTGKFTTAIAR